MVLSDHYLTFVKDQVELLAKTFAHTDVYVRYHPATEISRVFPAPRLKAFRKDSLIDRVNLPENVSIHTVPQFYLPFSHQFRRIGKPYYTKIKDRITENKAEYDLVHAHFTWPNGFVGAKLKEEYGFPFVITAHGYDVYDLPFRDAKWRDLITGIFDSADAIITVSHRNHECINQLDIETPVHVLPNGFRSDLFYARDPVMCRDYLNLPQDKKILLTVANLEPVKGQKYLIEAIGEVVREREDVLCIIIGRGRLERTLKRQIHSLDLADYVILAGGKPHYEVPLWMNAADLFVLSSLNEGNPTVMFEALGCGKPFVGTRVGGIPEIITSEDYGLLVKPGNVQDLADILLKALTKEWDSERIAAYARQYSWGYVVDRIIQVYNDVLY
ncbi:MAG: glycosyltransferase family 4 protein [Candidatus Methanoculleus thermohydrogenotrophicum]